MRILIEVTHPAHAHFFRHPIRVLAEQGNTILVTSRSKECTSELLEELGIENETISRQGSGGFMSMACELVNRNRALMRVVSRFKPDVISAVGGTSAAQVGWLKRRPTIVFYDTEDARLQNAITYPFATNIVVPECYSGWVPKTRTQRYRGYHELSYLHPDCFTPDHSIAVENGLAQEGETYLIRLVSWKASHDRGISGWSEETLESTLAALSVRGQVLVSSETPLPERFRSWQYKGKYDALHHVMSFCRLYVGESATMASEAAILGVPAIYAAPAYRGYVSEQESRYGLSRFVSEPTEEIMLRSLEEMLANAPQVYRERRARLLSDCVDVPRLITETITETGIRGFDRPISA